MQLKIRTQPCENAHGGLEPYGFSVVVENADTGEFIPCVQKVVLTMDVENFATATITVAGVQVESEVFVNAALADILTRPNPETLQTNGGIALDLESEWGR